MGEAAIEKEMTSRRKAYQSNFILNTSQERKRAETPEHDDPFAGLDAIGRFIKREQLREASQLRRLAEDSVTTSEVLISLAFFLMTFTAFHFIWKRVSRKENRRDL